MSFTDPILNLIDTLPPTGMEIGIKVIVYSFLSVVILAAFLTFLSTRGRRSATPVAQTGSSLGMLSHERDKVFLLKVQLHETEQILEEIARAGSEGQISSSGQLKLSKYYTTEKKLIVQKLKEYGGSELVVSSEEDAVSSDLEEIEAINRQLETEKDDFFSSPAVPETKPTPSVNPFASSSGGEKVPEVTVPPVTPHAVAQPTAAPEVTSNAEVAKPISPPISKPIAPHSSPSVTPPVTPPKSPTPPTSQPPASEPPLAANPLAAKKTELDEEQDKFAQSTSIAALRSDMLRELARLRKYIDEGDE